MCVTSNKNTTSQHASDPTDQDGSSNDSSSSGALLKIHQSGDHNLETIEIGLVLEAILRRYGYDFRNYARASLKRRLLQRAARSDLVHLSELIPRILHDESFFAEFLSDLSITVTEIFRDPTFYIALKEQVIPRLRTYPFVKIWHAGCATGEEVYSMAIALHEAGLYERSRIYATDFNNRALDAAKEGVFSLERIREGTANYYAAGGTASFADYFTVDEVEGVARMRDDLRDNVVFSHHNLVHDESFGEMHLVVCRNVLIYFNRDLQSRVLKLFNDSLVHHGFLCLGSKESVTASESQQALEAVNQRQRIYRRVAQ